MRRLRQWRWMESMAGHAGLATLDALAWGELEESRARRVLRHVSKCPRCRRRFEWVRTLPAILDRVRPDAFSADVTAVLARRKRGERILLPIGGASARTSAGPGPGTSGSGGRP